MTKTLPNRIRELRKKAGLSLQGLADLTGTRHGSVIQKLETGDRQLNQHWMDRISKALNVSPAELLQKHTGVDPIWIIGTAQSGHMEDWPETSRFPLTVPVTQEHEKSRKFALEVRDVAINEVYSVGSIVVCVPIGKDTLLIDGARYIVHRRTSEGVERIVREYSIQPDGKPRLWPRSTDPDHITPMPVHGNPGEEVTIIARIIGSYRPEQ